MSAKSNRKSVASNSAKEAVVAAKEALNEANLQAIKESAVPLSPTNVYEVTAADLKPNLSFDFNCRSPSRHSKAYISMRETLKEAPELFIQLNGGITVAGDYILDGGHTYLAIRDAISAGELSDATRASVRITDMGKLSKDQMAMRSVALNRRVTPPLTGERDILGHWDKLKANIKNPNLYEFRPHTNENAKYDVSFLIALLNGWHSKTAEKSYSSKGSLVRLYSDDKYAKLLPLLNQMAEVYSLIYEMLLADEKTVSKLAGYIPARVVTLPDGHKTEGYLPEAYIWPIYGAFKSLINEQGELVEGPAELLSKKKSSIVKTLLSDYKRSGSGPAKYGKDGVNYLNMTIAILGTK